MFGLVIDSVPVVDGWLDGVVVSILSIHTMIPRVGGRGLNDKRIKAASLIPLGGILLVAEKDE